MNTFGKENITRQRFNKNFFWSNWGCCLQNTKKNAKSNMQKYLTAKAQRKMRKIAILVTIANLRKKRSFYSTLSLSFEILGYAIVCYKVNSTNSCKFPSNENPNLKKKLINQFEISKKNRKIECSAKNKCKN